MPNIRSKLVTGAAVAAAAVGGASIANAATNSSTSSSSSSAPAQHGTFDPSKGGHTFNGETETLLTGEVATKVRQAALTKVSGTVERVETNVDDNVPYEAHIRKSDGTEVTVEVDRTTRSRRCSRWARATRRRTCRRAATNAARLNSRLARQRARFDRRNEPPGAAVATPGGNPLSAGGSS